MKKYPSLMWLVLLVGGWALVLGACFVAHYAVPSWTGAIVGVMVTLGAVALFLAGWKAGSDTYRMET